ncbi:MAG: hypothetical protein WA210_08375, partial [Burkholderiaceae bacterium]
MIAGLGPYAGYKDSGLLWLGHVPKHWEVRRIKTVLREVDRRSSTGLEPLLSLRMRAGLVDHHALGGRPIPPSALIGYKRVLPGEIVMNRMRASSGLFAAATSDGLVSPDYAIFRPIHQVNVPYAVQLFRTPAMTAVFRLESTGLGTGESGFLRLYLELTRFRGHLILMEEGVRNANTETPVSGGIPPTDGRTGPSRA